MRIKVTGYINPDDLDEGWVDRTHHTGLTDTGYDEISSGWSVGDLEPVTLELEAGE
jgi:hypothetical protein